MLADRIYRRRKLGEGVQSSSLRRKRTSGASYPATTAIHGVRVRFTEVREWGNTEARG